MQSSRNPAKSRPLSANVKRLMRLARASPQNSKVIKFARAFTARDLAYCHKQGTLFMEASSMGFSMSDFAPLFMTSQLAGVFDSIGDAATKAGDGFATVADAAKERNTTAQTINTDLLMSHTITADSRRHYRSMT